MMQLLFERSIAKIRLSSPDWIKVIQHGDLQATRKEKRKGCIVLLECVLAAKFWYLSDRQGDQTHWTEEVCKWRECWVYFHILCRDLPWITHWITPMFICPISLEKFNDPTYQCFIWPWLIGRPSWWWYRWRNWVSWWWRLWSLPHSLRYHLLLFHHCYSAGHHSGYSIDNSLFTIYKVTKSLGYMVVDWKVKRLQKLN